MQYFLEKKDLKALHSPFHFTEGLLHKFRVSIFVLQETNFGKDEKERQS
jgi:hypothetical protein